MICIFVNIILSLLLVITLLGTVSVSEIYLEYFLVFFYLILAYTTLYIVR